MDAESTVARASRLEALLEVILRNTWLSVTGLGITVAGDSLAAHVRPVGVAVFVGFVVSAVGVLMPYRPQRLGCLVGLVAFAIRVWSALIALFLAVGLVLIP